MRLVVLLSGGKDSVAAIEVARQTGFDVTHALVMHPAADDAMLYHVPNLAVVKGIADCLGLTYIEANSRSGQAEEVDDLEAALRPLAPHVDGILTGALRSEYQRVRIDRVAHILGLKSFHPLWHKDTVTHMAQITRAYHVVFSRTAADGVSNDWAGEPITPDTLEAMQGHPSRPDIAGEGGEYESLVLAAPHFEGRIVVEKSEVERTATRATWRVRRWRREPSAANPWVPAPENP